MEKAELNHIRLPHEDYRKQQKLVLKKGDHEVGELSYTFYGKPFRFLHLAKIDVYPAYQGLGYGKQLMEYFQDHCSRLKCAGILRAFDGTLAVEMYKRYGWKHITGSFSWYGFNLPVNVSPGTMTRAIRRTSINHGSGVMRDQARNRPIVIDSEEMSSH